MLSGWKHIPLFVGAYALGWYRGADPMIRNVDYFVRTIPRRPAKHPAPKPVAASVTLYTGTPITRASGVDACISTDMHQADDFDGCCD